LVHDQDKSRKKRVNNVGDSRGQVEGIMGTSSAAEALLQVKVIILSHHREPR